MNYKEFISNQEWIKFNYPSNLTFLEEVEGTYLFYTESTGSFRITPLKLEGNKNFNANKYLHDLSEENNGKILINKHNHKYVDYISNSEDDENDLIIFNWIFVESNKIIYCSYTIDAVTLHAPEIISENKEVIKIIENLIIL